MIRRSAMALSALILGATPALADPFNINVSSSETSMLLLTVTDMNSPDPKVAFKRQHQFGPDDFGLYQR